MTYSLIWTQTNVLTPEFCQNCIDKFEQDDRKSTGLLGAESTINLDIKRSVDLQISKKIGMGRGDESIL